MTYRISVDTGGTFTDVVVVTPKGDRIIGKALTTRARAFEGMSEAIADAAGRLSLTLESLLAQTGIIIYGTTRATNAIVTRRVAKTAFLTTAGFPDTLVLKEGGRPRAHDFSRDYPEPYIPRRHTFEIVERMTSEGTVSIPLAEAQARAVLAELKASGYEAIGVSFLWSIVNPDHEKLVGGLIGEMLPGVPYTLSHELIPVLREYRRASATVIDASLKPLMQHHLRELDRDLDRAGFAGTLLVSTSIGGCMLVDEVIQRPIHMAKSGPSMAPVAARTFGAMEESGGDVIVCDTGGTTFDVGLVRAGELVYSRETWLGGERIGDLLGISSVDIRSVGAGGGSIVWIDDGGLMRVGPQSAGSEPGPACYGRGGRSPTVSDAVCVLGYLNPSYFLGGRMDLDVDSARAAIGTIATQIGRSIEATAYDVLNLTSELMIKAIHDITIAEGFNPNDCVLVAGGGAAGMNTMLIARELGCRKVILPKEASALSACGMQFADIAREESLSGYTTSAQFDAGMVNRILEELERRLLAFLPRLGSLEQIMGASRIEFFADARYESQVWELETLLPLRRADGKDQVAALLDAFHDTHERVFAIRDPGSVVEFITWKARLWVNLGIKPGRAATAARRKVAVASTSRRCFFGADAPIETQVFRGSNLGAGDIVVGPSVIEEPTTTIVVFPNMTATVSEAGNYLLSFE
jgi:N-methylhydantoinase A